MESKTIQTKTATPYHVRKWLDSQLSIMEKPHKITDTMEVYIVAKNFKIVKK